MDHKTKLVYILAASHSGSTLLAMLLGSHPQVCTVGELKFTELGDIERYRCSCLQNIRTCPFWTGIVADMIGRGFDFDLKDAGTDFHSLGTGFRRYLLRPLHRGPFLESLRDAGLSLSSVWRKGYKNIQAKNSALLECITGRTGKRVVVDSSKIALRLKYLLRNPSIDIRIVRLIRDGRAVALTYMDSARFADASDRNLRGGGMGIAGRYPRLSMQEAALEWRRSNEEAEALLHAMDRKKWIEIRYESFCRDPLASLGRIFDLVDVPQEDVLANFRTAVHHVVGNGMRLDTSRRIQLDERWKDVLGGEDLAVFDSIGGSLNRKLGYI